jgi:hypothetical protein
MTIIYLVKKFKTLIKPGIPSTRSKSQASDVNMCQIKPINFSIIVSILHLVSGYQQLFTTLCKYAKQLFTTLYIIRRTRFVTNLTPLCAPDILIQLYKFISTVEFLVASFIKDSNFYHFKRETHIWSIHCKLNLIT